MDIEDREKIIEAINNVAARINTPTWGKIIHLIEFVLLRTYIDKRDDGQAFVRKPSITEIAEYVEKNLWEE